ncbi:DUF4407 domain-containing protein [Mycobacterium sp.]|uniref:DUF4407 domain-containing protein n=1 Tax=Mycobacterium sp. TaxID=1785 RepID=UPI003D6BD5D4
MCARKVAEPRSAGSWIEAGLTWLGGGHWHELGERHEQSTHAIAGAVVLLDAALAWLVAALAVAESVGWPILAVLPLSLVFGLLVGAITRAIASGPTAGRRGILGRGAVAVAVGLVVGEFAALAAFSGSVDRRIDDQMARNADSMPAVAHASANLQQARNARLALDEALDAARTHRDEALVIARCEYNPAPVCPQTRITGVPGVGPETRTANELLADSQTELDNALAARDRRAPRLDSQIDYDVAELAQARHGAVAGADHGPGARWVAMQDLTMASLGALLLRILIVAFLALLSLLPLILRLWRGETTHDRRASARAERDRAELDADTAIAVKRAEMRAAAETMWAEQQFAQARLAVEAQTEIDRAQQRRRVVDAIEGLASATSQRIDDDIFLPIAAEAEAASLAATELPAAVEPREAHDGPAIPAIPTIPDVTKAAARWIRPLVPTFVARAIDTTTHPLRSARQVFEEVEEVTFSFKRTRKVTLNTEETVSRSPGSIADDDDFGAPSEKPELTERGPHQLPPAE